jgi:hypothetical protein
MRHCLEAEEQLYPSERGSDYEQDEKQPPHLPDSVGHIVRNSLQVVNRPRQVVFHEPSPLLETAGSILNL